MAEEKKKRKKLSEKQVKITIAIIIVLLIVGIMIWAMIPNNEIYEVSDLLDDPDKYDGEELSLQGVVIKWDSSTVNFTLGDSNDDNLAINITYTGTIPENFGINSTVTVTGVFHKDPIHVESNEIQTGCPSKY